MGKYYERFFTICKKSAIFEEQLLNNTTMEGRKPRDHSFILKLFRTYLRYANSLLYFRKEHLVDRENVPENGTPILLVSNHQNCLNDPLCVCLNLRDRRLNYIARANVFKHPLINKILRSFGMLPAYRASHDGLAAVAKNKESMDEACGALMNGETLIMYPEGSHQRRRWLGEFKINYLRIAFDAAERMNFERDVVVLPSCNHYSNYHHARIDMLMKFGKPISLNPYYEQFKESPRETMRLVNERVRSEVEALMLNVEDLDHYDEIDLIRQSAFGDSYAKRLGYKPKHLPSRLLADKRLVAELQGAYEADREGMERLYADTKEYNNGLKSLQIRDWLFAKGANVGSTMVRGLMLLILFPLLVASLIPTFPLFLIPKIFIKRMIKDRMFISSFNVAVCALIGIPICLMIPLILIWIFAGFWWALGYFALFPLMYIFVWNYVRLWHKFMGSCRFVAGKNRAKIAHLDKLRSSIFERLERIIK